VWFDALCNYVAALGYGTGDDAYRQWWISAGRRVHLLGKGVLRFHAVYWPAMLLSSGQPLPTDIVVHDYLTAGGRKISKSSGSGADPVALAAEYGTDAVRWWLLREVPRAGDADFTIERMIARADDELANGLGNLVNRVVAMIAKYRGGRVPGPQPVAAGGEDLTAAIRHADGRIAAALEDFDFRQATAAVWAIADEANRFINRVRPWELARAESADAAVTRQLDAVLRALFEACSALGRELAPFLPDAAARITDQCAPGDDGRLPAGSPVFRRLAPGSSARAAVSARGGH
jgi:methionyl-tRNA synthetase